MHSQQRLPFPTTGLRVEDLIGVGVAALEEKMYGSAMEWLMAAEQINNEGEWLQVLIYFLSL